MTHPGETCWEPSGPGTACVKWHSRRKMEPLVPTYPLYVMS